MEWLSKKMDVISKWGLLLVFGTVFTVGIIIKAVYRFDDSPGFALISGKDVLSIAVVLVCFFLLLRYRDRIQKKLNVVGLSFVYLVGQGAYLYLVPLKPFSDMEYVYQAAYYFSAFQWDNIRTSEYLQMFSGNIDVGLFYGLFMLVLPKTIWSIKFVNALLLLSISIFIMLICREYGMKYYKVIFLLSLMFLPLFLYSNHIYYDVPFLVLCLLGVYIYVKKKNIIFSFVAFGLAKILRVNVYIFMAAFLLDWIFGYVKKRERTLKNTVIKILQGSIAVFLAFVLSVTVESWIHSQFITEQVKGYPIWNQIYIGLNEEKIGFMDGDFSYERSAQDVIDRIRDYGPVRMVKILGKKIFWTWSQGTYQAQRYAFGYDVEEANNKFYYSTLLSDYLMRDEQPLRKIINSMMRAQYMILFGLMLATIYDDRKKNVEKYRWLYYSLIATVLMLIVWEMKSRYILHCYPLMCILACRALENNAINLN